MRALTCVLMMLSILLARGLRAEDKPAAAPDPALPYQCEKSNPVTYDVDFSVVVTAPYKTKVLKVWLPMPQTDSGCEPMAPAREPSVF